MLDTMRQAVKEFDRAWNDQDVSHVDEKLERVSSCMKEYADLAQVNDPEIIKLVDKAELYPKKYEEIYFDEEYDCRHLKLDHLERTVLDAENTLCKFLDEVQS